MDVPGGSGSASEDPADPAARRQAQVSASRERFAAIARLPDAEIDLAEAALLVAAEEFPGLDVQAYLHRLDALAERVRRRLVLSRRWERGDADEAALEALHTVLFDEEGFVGEVAGTADGGLYPPRNSFLNDVMDRKRGMPITLSVIYVEVARRAGLDAVGIAAPLHFIVQFRGRHTSTLVDPFNRGQRLDPAALPEAQIIPATRKAILARILTNLKHVYIRRQQYMKALAAIERILAVNPSPGEVRDRGLVLQKLGEHLLREGRERFRRDRDAGPEAQGTALVALKAAMQHSLHLLGASWFDLALYARIAEGTPGAADDGQRAAHLWKLLGRQN
jgi:regulator of sirC expression with transglutaminase-like and TPR domain